MHLTTSALWFLALLVPMTSASAGAPINNCLPQDYQDRRGESVVVVANDNPSNPFLYRPRCALVTEGTVIEFRASPNFGMHPLFGGTVAGGVATMDPESPIGSIISGDVREVLLEASGDAPYFCDVHFLQGMLGAIRVVPELFADGFD